MSFDRELVKQLHSELDKLQVGQCLYKTLERKSAALKQQKAKSTTWDEMSGGRITGMVHGRARVAMSTPNLS